jgi:hypothetical protein
MAAACSLGLFIYRAIAQRLHMFFQRNFILGMWRNRKTPANRNVQKNMKQKQATNV